MKIKALVTLLFSLVCILTAGLLYVSDFSFRGTQTVSAQIGGMVPLAGWAFASTENNEGIGWISFNCSNNNSCASSNYKVIMNTGNGDLSGYAWANPRDDAATTNGVVTGSNNIGWISFNASDVAGCPSAPCTPRVDLVSGAVIGWVRVLSADPAQGWDGWISLSGTNFSSPGGGGLTYDTTSNRFTGYGWGSDVVGWVNFDPTCPGMPECGMALEGFNYNVNTSVNPNVQPGAAVSLGLYITHTSGVIQPVIFRRINFPAGVTTGTFTGGGSTCTPSGSGCAMTVTFGGVITPGSYTLTVITGSAGRPDKATNFDIVVDQESPRINIKANGVDGPLTINKGQVVRLSWSHFLPAGNGGPVQAISTICSLSVSLDNGVTYTSLGNFNSTQFSYTTHPVTRTETYRINCTGYTNTTPSQSTSASDTVILRPKQGGFEEF